MLSDRFIEPNESLQSYRSQHARGRTALIGALLIAVLLAELDSAALANESKARPESSAAPSAGQKVLVVQEGPGKVILFSAKDPSRRQIIKVGEKPHEIELTPDGRSAFVSNFGLLEVNHQVGTPGTTISVLDVDRGVERTRFRLPAGATAPHGLELRPPKNQLSATQNRQQAMIVFDPNSGRVLRSLCCRTVCTIFSSMLTARHCSPIRRQTKFSESILTAAP